MSKTYRFYRKVRLFFELLIKQEQPISVGPCLAWEVAGIVWDS